MKPVHYLARIGFTAVGVAGALVSTLPAVAMDMKGMPPPASTSPGSESSPTVRGTGVVKAVDKAQGTVTLAHDPIKSINWPAMTMAFKVKDKTLLDSAKTGARVDFTLEKAGNDYVITSVKQ